MYLWIVVGISPIKTYALLYVSVYFFLANYVYEAVLFIIFFFNSILQVKNSSLKLMQTVCEKLYIPTRTAPLYPFGQPAAAVEEAKAVAPAEGEEAVTTGNMLDEAQVGFIF